MSKKIKNRVLMIMLAAVMAFGLVACTGDAKDTKEKTKISRESEDEDDDEDDDEDKDSKKDKKKDKKDKKDKHPKKQYSGYLKNKIVAMRNLNRTEKRGNREIKKLRNKETAK